MFLRLRLLIAVLAVAGVSGKHFFPRFSNPNDAVKTYALFAGAQAIDRIFLDGFPTNEPATTLLVLQASAVNMNTAIFIGSRYFF
jgi:hypothetical protein